MSAFVAHPFVADRTPLAALLGDPPASLEEKLGGIRTAVESAARTALDASRPVAQRVDAPALVQGNLFPLAERLIAPRQPPELQTAACRALTRHDRSKVADFFFARWDALAPVPRREALTLITGNNATTLRLMKKMKSGEISPALMPAMKRWTLGRSSDPAVKDLVAELFGKMEANRAKVGPVGQVARLTLLKAFSWQPRLILRRCPVEEVARLARRWYPVGFQWPV